MITTERELLRYLCGNNGLGVYYEVQSAGGEYYLRKFWHRADYGKQLGIDRTLVVRMSLYGDLLHPTTLHPTDAAFRKYWCEK